MAQRCELTGTRPLSGHNVSHSNRKTKRRFLPNLHTYTIMSDALGRAFRFRITARALRSVDHRGGLDAFLLKAPDADLSPAARKVKKELQKKLAGQTADAPAA